MSYKKADKILPKELLEIIQQYVEGESIYIPRKTENRRSWGTLQESGRKSPPAIPGCSVIIKMARTPSGWQINTVCP